MARSPESPKEPGCYNSLYELQGRASGTPSAGPVARIASRGREVIERECVTETGAATRTKREGGGATVRLRGGGHVAPLRAEALRARRRRQVGLPRLRRSAVPAVTLRRWRACKRGPGPSSVPGILSPRKITVKGARCARVLRMARAPLLTVIFPGKTIGTYRLDGAVRALVSLRLRTAEQKPGRYRALASAYCKRPAREPTPARRAGQLDQGTRSLERVTRVAHLGKA